MKVILSIIQWLFAITFVLLAFGTGSVISSIFVLFAAMLMAPIKPIRNLLSKFKIKGWLAVILSIVLLFTGIIISPSFENTDSQNLNNQNETVYDDTNFSTTVNNEESSTKSEPITDEITTVERITEQTTETTTETITDKETSTKKAETSTKKAETSTKKAETSTKKAETTTQKIESTTKTSKITYVLNTNTMKFHYKSCNDVAKIKPENYGTYTGTREDVINLGYSSCGHCHP